MKKLNLVVVGYGGASILDWKSNCKVVKCKHLHENGVVPVKIAAGLSKTMAPRNEHTTETYEKSQPTSDVHNFYHDVYKAIQGEEEQLVTHKQLRRVLQVIETAFRSVEQKAEIAREI